MPCSGDWSARSLWGTERPRDSSPASTSPVPLLPRPPPRCRQSGPRIWFVLSFFFVPQKKSAAWQRFPPLFSSFVHSSIVVVLAETVSLSPSPSTHHAPCDTGDTCATCVHSYVENVRGSRVGRREWTDLVKHQQSPSKAPFVNPPKKTPTIKKLRTCVVTNTQKYCATRTKNIKHRCDKSSLTFSNPKDTCSGPARLACR